MKKFEEISEIKKFINDVLQKNILCLFYKLNESPIVSLYDSSKENWILDLSIKFLKRNVIYVEENLKKVLMKTIDNSFKKFELLLNKDLNSVNDLSEILSEEICYEARESDDLLSLLEKKDPTLIRPLKIVS